MLTKSSTRRASASRFLPLLLVLLVLLPLPSLASIITNTGTGGGSNPVVPGGASGDIQVNDGSGGFAAYGGIHCSNAVLTDLNAAGIDTVALCHRVSFSAIDPASLTGTLTGSSALLPTDAAVKAYVDGLVGVSLSWKDKVVAASTANGTLSTAFENGDVLDGVTLHTGDRILLKDQTAQAANGIYVVQASGAPVRATDLDSSGEFGGATVNVEAGGVVNSNHVFTQTTLNPVVGTDPIVWVQINAGTSLTAGDGITISSGVVSVDFTVSRTSSGSTNAIPVYSDSVTLTSSGLSDNGSTVRSLRGQQDNVNSVSTNFTLTPSHNVVFMTTGNSDKTFTLPSASGLTGQRYTGLIKADSGSGGIILLPNGTDTINGLNAATQAITCQHCGYEVQWESNTGWNVALRLYLPPGYLYSNDSNGNLVGLAPTLAGCLRSDGTQFYVGNCVSSISVGDPITNSTANYVLTVDSGNLLANYPTSGNNHLIGTVSGALTTSKQLEFDGSGNIVASASDIGGGGGGSSLLQSTTMSLNAADLHAIFTNSPLSLVAAPGSQKMIVPVSLTFLYAAGTHRFFSLSGLGTAATMTLGTGNPIAFINASTTSIFDTAYFADSGINGTPAQGILNNDTDFTAFFNVLNGDRATGSGYLDTSTAINVPLVLQVVGGDLTNGVVATTGINAPGTGYAVGDTLVDNAMWGNADLLVTIDTVDGGGGVLTYHITDVGTSGWSVGGNPSSSIIGFDNTAPQSGVGTGFQLDVLSINVGDGALDITALYYVIDVTTGEAIAGTPPGGSGTAGFIPKWTSSTAQGNSQLFDSGTKIMLGSQTNGDFDTSTVLGVVGQAEVQGNIFQSLNLVDGGAGTAFRSFLDSSRTGNDSSSHFPITFELQFDDDFNIGSWTHITIEPSYNGTHNVTSFTALNVSPTITSSGTIGDLYGMLLDPNTSTSATNKYGLFLGNLGPATNAYGIYISDPQGSGTNDYGLWNAGKTHLVGTVDVQDSLKFAGATSGTTTLKAAAIAGTNTLTLPTGATNFTTNASALTSNLPVIGAGSNATAVGTRQGNTTAFVTATGSFTSGNLTKTDASGNLVDAGAPAASAVAQGWFSTGIPFTNGSVNFTGTTAMKVTAFYVPYTVSISRILFDVGTQDVTNKYDVCIYDTAGGFGGTSNLLADLSTDGTNGVVTLSGTGTHDTAFHQGTVTLNPGWYIFAMASNSATGALNHDTSSTNYAPFTAQTSVSSSATASGACNSTLAAPAANWTLSGKPKIALR